MSEWPSWPVDPEDSHILPFEGRLSKPLHPEALGDAD
jgi:hypothetical protein